ncbi:MAG: NifU family protein [Bacteroidia bacterium]|nr:NifU family protein [Bacteroidia bacterium]
MEDIRKRIESALDTIRPYLQSDGGDVRIYQILPDNSVELELIGACGNCSMSQMTMKAGIEQAIRKAVPEVSSVTTINPNFHV